MALKELLADMYKNASDEDRAGLRDAMWPPQPARPLQSVEFSNRLGCYKRRVNREKREEDARKA